MGSKNPCSPKDFICQQKISTKNNHFINKYIFIFYHIFNVYLLFYDFIKKLANYRENLDVKEYFFSVKGKDP